MGLPKHSRAISACSALLRPPAVFVFAKYACLRLESSRCGDALHSWKQRLSKIASLTFGVYLTHNYFTIYLPIILPIDRYGLGWRIGGVINLRDMLCDNGNLGKSARRE